MSEWNSDVPISAPRVDNSIIGSPAADLGGMVFVNGALRLPVTSVMRETRYVPRWSPTSTPGRRVPRGRSD